MKKSLIALAALAAVGAASAQSSVTLSGRLNVGANSIKTTAADNGASASVTAGDYTGAEGTKTGSRLTVAGVEDLGGGLRASFDFTAALSPTERGGAVTTRRSNVTLSGGFGSFSMGSFDTNALDQVRGLSPHVPNAAGGDIHTRMTNGAFLNGNANAANAATQTGFLGTASNAVVYSLPAFGSLKTSISAIEQKRLISAATPLAADEKVSANMFGADYTAGPLTARFGLARGKLSDVDGGGAGEFVKSTAYSFGVAYDLGVVVPHVIHERSKLTDQNPGEHIKTISTEVGVKFPMGALTPYALVGKGKFKDEGGTFAKTSAYQVGLNYDFSKRTSVYATMGRDKIAAEGDDASVKRTGYSLGIVHLF